MNIYGQAIQLEKDGAAYYEEQAAKHPNTAISGVFTVLAEAERKHEAAIIKYQEDKGFEEPEATQPLEKTFFATAADVDNEIFLVPRALDAYLTALEMERKSIEMYQELLDKSEDETEKALLAWLVEEEKLHYDQIDKLAEMIRHGDDYVTHAMFANPREY
ncbi:MAG TPA: ferritin family protein [Clostridiaceae bacterium]|nr:ferritin family protein [Clostridiaceae bacterium]